MILSWLKKFNISNMYIAVQIEIGWKKPLEDREFQDTRGHFVAMKTVVADVITVYINIAGFENKYKLIRSHWKQMSIDIKSLTLLEQLV